MRKVEYAITGFITIFIGAWIIGTYASLEPNPLRWSEAGRTLHAIFSLTVGALGGLAAEDLFEDE